jgi:hypothetical protein
VGSGVHWQRIFLSLQLSLLRTYLLCLYV